MGWFRSFLHRAGQTDEERLSDEILEWAESVPGTRRMDACPAREPVRVTGVVNRLTVRPQDGSVTLEAVVTDGSGEIVAAWTGRDHIEGLHLGTRLVLEGVIGRQRHGRSRMVNPDFEFA
jgi:RecG-like helicase